MHKLAFWSNEKMREQKEDFLRNQIKKLVRGFPSKKQHSHHSLYHWCALKCTNIQWKLEKEHFDDDDVLKQSLYE